MASRLAVFGSNGAFAAASALTFWNVFVKCKNVAETLGFSRFLTAMDADKPGIR